VRLDLNRLKYAEDTCHEIAHIGDSDIGGQKRKSFDSRGEVERIIAVHLKRTVSNSEKHRRDRIRVSRTEVRRVKRVDELDIARSKDNH
jgi:hypothetical protein